MSDINFFSSILSSVYRIESSVLGIVEKNLNRTILYSTDIGFRFSCKNFSKKLTNFESKFFVKSEIPLYDIQLFKKKQLKVYFEFSRIFVKRQLFLVHAASF